jgi:hypothetical protein
VAFDPLAWRQVAHQLGAQPDEAALRTAVGRHYYGVFLRTRIWLQESGRLPGTGREAKEHGTVINYLKAQRQWSQAGAALDDLYRRRTHADYDHRLPVGAAQAQRAAELADDVAADLQAEWDQHPLT